MPSSSYDATDGVGVLGLRPDKAANEVVVVMLDADTVAAMGGTASVVSSIELALGTKDADAADDTAETIDALVPPSSMRFGAGLETAN